MAMKRRGRDEAKALPPRGTPIFLSRLFRVDDLGGAQGLGLRLGG